MPTRANTAMGLGAVALAPGLLLLTFAASCINLGPFDCTDDEQCRIGEDAGVCVAPGHCALPDASCPSGFSYHNRAPSNLVGQCTVPTVVSTGSESSTSTSTGSGTLDPSSTGAASTTTASTSSGGGSDTQIPGTATGVSCGDRPCACAVEIAAGEEHTCVVRDDGSVACWGVNTDGELGTGAAGDPLPWPQLVALPPGVTASKLRVGNHVSCVTGSDTVVYCWGRNTSGEVVPSSRIVSQPVPVAVDWTPTGGVVMLSPRHTCIASAGGATVGCFGENIRGQLGNALPGPGPLEVVDPMALLPPVAELAGGSRHTCARTGTAVTCWGADQGGALGNGLPFEDTVDPLPVMLDGDAVLLTSGRFHACATLGDGRRMQCWGSNNLGQLAAGMEGGPSAVPVDAADLFETPVVTLVSRMDSTCAMMESGEVQCWGYNGEDKYGTGSPFEPLPVPVPILDEVTEPVLAVALGDRHMCVISDGAHVWCWGDDTLEQLGPFDPMRGERAVELDLRCPEPA